MSSNEQQPSPGRLFWIIGMTVGIISGVVVALTLAALVMNDGGTASANHAEVGGVAIQSGL